MLIWRMSPFEAQLKQRGLISYSSPSLHWATFPPLFPKHHCSHGNCWVESHGTSWDVLLWWLSLKLIESETSHNLQSRLVPFTNSSLSEAHAFQLHSYLLPPPWAFLIVHLVNNFDCYVNNAPNIPNLCCFSGHSYEPLALERVKSHSTFSFYKSSSKMSKYLAI